MILRPYQSRLIADINSQWASGNQRVMAQLPTGSGKTHVFSQIAKSAAEQGARCLVLAHREELITQAAAKLHQATGESIGIIKSGYDFEPQRRLQVASVQTLINRLDKTGPFDLVVCDEAHHSAALSYKAIFSHYGQAAHLGVTGTPCRTDGAGFRDVYDALVTGPTTSELIKLGHLSPYRLIADAQQMSLKGVKTTAGDYNQRQLADANDAIELAGSLVGSYQDLAAGKQAIVFAINCEHSQAIAQTYREAGIAAVHLDAHSSSDERKAALKAFSDGAIKVLCNVGLFTEGFDLPAIEVVQVARPTQSLSLWLQMLGRGLRTSPGKTEALLIDHTDNWQRLGTPTRPRFWTLDGVEIAPREVTRNPDGEVVEKEPLIVTETPVDLEEIIIDPLEEWRSIWSELVAVQTERGYKPGWIGYQLAGLNPSPPLEIWQAAAAHLGYKPGWAWHQWQAAQEGVLVA